jgi:hypothetical protein
MLPPNDAWLLDFFALVLTAVFIRLLSVRREAGRGPGDPLHTLTRWWMLSGF